MSTMAYSPGGKLTTMEGGAATVVALVTHYCESWRLSKDYIVAAELTYRILLRYIG